MPEGISVLRDTSGAIYYTATDSPFAQNGVASGELTDVEEVRGAPSDDHTGDDHDAGAGDRGPDVRQRGTGPADGAGAAGVAGPEVHR